MSLGAVAVGVGFSLALLSLVYLLNKRFNAEESVVQVTATITTAYLSYYVAEAVLGMSGVISVVTCGIMTKFCASSIFNDPGMIALNSMWVCDASRLLHTNIACCHRYDGQVLGYCGTHSQFSSLHPRWCGVGNCDLQ